jgi:hypothetical protein
VLAAFRGRESAGGYSTIGGPAPPRGHLAQERNVGSRVGWVVLIGLGAAGSMQSGKSRQVKPSLVAVEQCGSIVACGGRNYYPPFWHVGSRSGRKLCHRSAQGLRIPHDWHVA